MTPFLNGRGVELVEKRSSATLTQKAFYTLLYVFHSPPSEKGSKMDSFLINLRDRIEFSVLDLVVAVVEQRSNKIKVFFKAPKEIKIYRLSIWQRMVEEGTRFKALAFLEFFRVVGRDSVVVDVDAKDGIRGEITLPYNDEPGWLALSVSDGDPIVIAR